MSTAAIVNGLIFANEGAMFVEDLVELYGRVQNGDTPTEEEIEAKMNQIGAKIQQGRDLVTNQSEITELATELANAPD